MALRPWIAAQARVRLSERLGTPVTVGSADASLPGRIVLRDIRSARGGAEEVQLALNFGALLHGRIQIDRGEAKNVKAPRGEAATVEARREPEDRWRVTLHELRATLPGGLGLGTAPIEGELVVILFDADRSPREVSVYRGRALAISGIDGTASRTGPRWHAEIDSPSLRGTVAFEPPNILDLDLTLNDAALDGLPVPHLALARAHASGTLRASRDGPVLSAAFDLALRGIDLLHPAASARPIRDLDGQLAGRFRADTATGTLDLAHGITLRRGALALSVTGSLARDADSALAIDLSRAPCDGLLAALSPLLPTLDGMALRGEAEAHARISVPAHRLPDLALDVDLDVGCTVDRDAPLADPRMAADRADALLRAADDTPPDTPLLFLDQMPRDLVRAFLGAEDAKFFDHAGFDLFTIRRALAADLEARAFDRGASTITQQLARTLFLDGERTVSRKLEEAVIAWRMEQVLPKARILSMYLDVLELGPGVRGVSAGARHWLGKDASRLTLDEAAQLAALAPAPKRGLDDAWSRRYRDLLEKLVAGEGERQLAAHPVGLAPPLVAPPRAIKKAAKTAPHRRLRPGTLRRK